MPEEPTQRWPMTSTWGAHTHEHSNKREVCDNQSVVWSDHSRTPQNTREARVEQYALGGEWRKCSDVPWVLMDECFPDKGEENIQSWAFGWRKMALRSECLPPSHLVFLSVCFLDCQWDKKNCMWWLAHTHLQPAWHTVNTKKALKALHEPHFLEEETEGDRA